MIQKWSTKWVTWSDATIFIRAHQSSVFYRKNKNTFVIKLLCELLIGSSIKGSAGGLFWGSLKFFEVLEILKRYFGWKFLRRTEELERFERLERSHLKSSECNERQALKLSLSPAYRADSKEFEEEFSLCHNCDFWIAIQIWMLRSISEEKSLSVKCLMSCRIVLNFGWRLYNGVWWRIMIMIKTMMKAPIIGVRWYCSLCSLKVY